MKRSSKYTPKRIELIIQGIKNLASKTEICKAVNITMQTYYEWYNTKTEFKKMVDDAEDETMEKIKSTAIKSVVKAMADDYRAATWYLERKHADEYGRKERVDTNMTIDAIKIKYILPQSEQSENINLLPEKTNEEDGI